MESLLRAEFSALLGYGKHDPAGRNSVDSRNGTYQRTLQSEVRGPRAGRGRLHGGRKAGRPEEGEAALEAFVAKWRPRYPRLAVWSERAEHVLTF